MEFFDRKEEVLDLQLTQYGKYLLSVGKLKPTYYAFFDDDIDYDTQYQGDPPALDHAAVSAGPSENQKETEDRVKETPRIKVIHSVDTVEKSANQINNDQSSLTINEVYTQFNITDPFGFTNPLAQPTPILIGTSTGLSGDLVGGGSGNNVAPGTEGGTLVGLPHKIGDFLSPTYGDIPYKYPIPKKQNTSGLKIPLGTSNYNSIYYPAFDMNLSKGKIKDSIYYDSGSFGISRIPQIEIEVTYETTIGLKGKDGKIPSSDQVVSIKESSDPAEFNYVTISDDGSFVKIEEDYISIDLKELNSLKEKENFVIEVYEIQNPDTENEILLPLKFGGEYFSNGYSDFLYDKTGNNLNATENYVEYFFKVSVDDEIETPKKPLGVSRQIPSNDFDLCEDDNDL
tara:strand:- start:11943 stop:13139 length:1197 start_codon:yes stop_codon:yes gene_type:complete